MAWQYHNKCFSNSFRIHSSTPTNLRSKKDICLTPLVITVKNVSRKTYKMKDTRIKAM